MKLSNYRLEFDDSGMSETERSLVRALWLVALQQARLFTMSKPDDAPEVRERSLLALREAFPGRAFAVHWVD
jgi:hypothetical protein